MTRPRYSISALTTHALQRPFAKFGVMLGAIFLVELTVHSLQLEIPGWGGALLDAAALTALASIIMWPLIVKPLRVALKAEQARAQMILDTASDAIITIDDHGIIQAQNRAARIMFRVSDQDAIGRSVSMYVPSPFRERHDQYLETYRQTGGKHVIGTTWQFDAVRIDGEVFPIELTMSEAWVGGRRFTTGIARDITERKRAEQRASDALNYNRLLLEVSPIGAIVYKATGATVSANEAAARMTNATVEELKAQNFREIESWKKSGMLNLAEHALASNGVVEKDIFFTPTTFGKNCWLSTRFAPFAHNSEQHLLGLFVDITERKRTEERLQKLSRAVEQSPAATIITDTHGHFEYVNPKFLEVTGYTREELIGKTPAIIKSDLTPRHVFEDLWRTILSGREWRGEMQNRRKNGELYWEHEIISSVKNERGEIVNYIAVKEDITEHKRAEEALQQKHARLLQTERELLSAHESLADADRLESVGRLAAGVAHEVKNPLTIIRLGVDYLSKQFSQEGNEEVLNDVRGAIDRAEHVIGDLLDFSKQKPFTPHPTDINQVIDKAIHLIKHEIKRRNLEIVRSRNDLMPPIHADPDRLVQVFVNLLSNAAQAIGQDGRIDVVTRLINVSERDVARFEENVFRPGEQVVAVEVIDNGPGFSAEHEKKLFEPFFTTKPVGEGTGLGLAVSRNIVIMHKGSIRISNHSGGGASALLMFRLAREHLTNEKTNTCSG